MKQATMYLKDLKEALSLLLTTTLLAALCLDTQSKVATILRIYR